MANSFISKKADLTSTDITTLYTVPTATTAIIKSILVSDDSGSGSTITIQSLGNSGAILLSVTWRAYGSDDPHSLFRSVISLFSGI